jgi:carbohydrate-selective porin OprB
VSPLPTATTATISSSPTRAGGEVYEAVLEFDYRIQVNKWFYAQPVLQYIIRPNGTGLVENATVLGFQLGVIF